MADSKISALAAAASAADANELAINEAGTSKKLTVAQIKTLISAATLGLPLALTGATAATRYVGATATGAPTSGTFAVGDFVITQDGSVYICTGAGSPGTWTAVSGGGGVSGVTFALTFVFDAGDSAISGNPECDIVITAAGTLTGWTLVAEPAGSIVIDLWKDVGANFPPTNVDSITNGHEPALAAANRATDADITDWTTTTLTVGDVIRAHVDSTATIKRATLTLPYTRS